MGQQALSTRVVGSTLVVETRLNLNMQSLTLEEVTSKRRKVVKDMVENVLADFGGEGKQYLEGLLEPLHTEPPEYYNRDENLGAAINDAVFRSNAVRGWAEGLKVLPELILERESLTLETTDATIWDGIGATLHHGKLQTLKCVRLHFSPDSTALTVPPALSGLPVLGRRAPSGSRSSWRRRRVSRSSSAHPPRKKTSRSTPTPAPRLCVAVSRRMTLPTTRPTSPDSPRCPSA